MQELKCDKCGKEFKTEQHMQYHLNRKTPCVKNSKIDKEKELILLKHNLKLEIIKAETKCKKELLEFEIKCNNEIFEFKKRNSLI